MKFTQSLLSVLSVLAGLATLVSSQSLAEVAADDGLSTLIAAATATGQAAALTADGALSK
jgi:hypothetical protein